MNNLVQSHYLYTVLHHACIIMVCMYIRNCIKANTYTVWYEILTGENFGEWASGKFDEKIFDKFHKATYY